MKAYLIANIRITDPAGFAQYRDLVPQVIARYGGQYLVRAGAVQRLEGDPALDRFVIIEFPSLAAARQFYDSSEYAPLLKLRIESADSDVAIVEGCVPV